MSSDIYFLTQDEVQKSELAFRLPINALVFTAVGNEWEVMSG